MASLADDDHFELCVGGSVVTVSGQPTLVFGRPGPAMTVRVGPLTVRVEVGLLRSPHCPPSLFSNAWTDQLETMHVHGWAPRLFPLVFDFIARRAAEPAAPLKAHALSREDSCQLDALADYVFPGMQVPHPVDGEGNKVVAMHGSYGLDLPPAGCMDHTLIGLMLRGDSEGVVAHLLAADYMCYRSPDAERQRKYARELYLETVAPGQPFRIHEYDGYQSLQELCAEVGWMHIL